MADETFNETVGTFYRQLEEDARLTAIPNPAFWAVLEYEDPSNLLPEGRRIAAGSNRAEVTSAALAIYRDILAARPELSASAAVMVYTRLDREHGSRCPILTLGHLDIDLAKEA